MIAQSNYSFSEPTVWPWQQQDGSFSIQNLNYRNPITVILQPLKGQSETVILTAYGDSLSISPKGLLNITISAASYPANGALVLSPIVGLTVATIAGTSEQAFMYPGYYRSYSATGILAGTTNLTTNGLYGGGQNDNIPFLTNVSVRSLVRGGTLNAASCLISVQAYDTYLDIEPIAYVISGEGVEGNSEKVFTPPFDLRGSLLTYKSNGNVANPWGLRAIVTNLVGTPTVDLVVLIHGQTLNPAYTNN